MHGHFTGLSTACVDSVAAQPTRTARERGYRRLYLETGTGAAFAAAHALYLRNGFEWGSRFGSYAATDFNAFMEKTL